MSPIRRIIIPANYANWSTYWSNNDSWSLSWTNHCSCCSIYTVGRTRDF